MCTVAVALHVVTYSFTYFIKLTLYLASCPCHKYDLSSWNLNSTYLGWTSLQTYSLLELNWEKRKSFKLKRGHSRVEGGKPCQIHLSIDPICPICIQFNRIWSLNSGSMAWERGRRRLSGLWAPPVSGPDMHFLSLSFSLLSVWSWRLMSLGADTSAYHALGMCDKFMHHGEIRAPQRHFI